MEGEEKRSKVSKEVTTEPEQHTAKDYRDPPTAPLVDLSELRLWSFYRALIAEFVATLLFLYVIVATVIDHKKQSDACGGNSRHHRPTPLVGPRRSRRQLPRRRSRAEHQNRRPFPHHNSFSCHGLLSLSLSVFSSSSSSSIARIASAATRNRTLISSRFPDSPAAKPPRFPSSSAGGIGSALPSQPPVSQRR